MRRKKNEQKERVLLTWAVLDQLLAIETILEGSHNVTLDVEDGHFPRAIVNHGKLAHSRAPLDQINRTTVEDELGLQAPVDQIQIVLSAVKGVGY